MVEEVRSVSFPSSMRGYDRDAVDAYVERVNRLIAELEISRSPEAAVKHAVAEVSEQTRGILEQAHQTAEEITARSRAKADDRLQLADREAGELREAAEARVGELDTDAEAIWSERLRLIEDVRDVAQRLMALADDAAERFPAAHPEEPETVAEDETPAEDQTPAEEPAAAPGDETVALPRDEERVALEDSEGEPSPPEQPPDEERQQ